MLYHFQFRGPAGWESLGSGVGTGERAIEQALAEIRRLSDGKLPCGAYRGIQASGNDARFIDFELRSPAATVS